MKVTFIGLGIMGSRMTANLLKNSIPLTVFNRSSGPSDKLASDGAIKTVSCRDAVKNADIVFTILSTPEAVAQVALADTGFISEMRVHH